METLACPRCGTEMETRPLATRGATIELGRCPEGHGVFLQRADLGALIDAENDWHRHAGSHTAPMPRITPDMEVPPSPARPARAWIETLFS